MNTMVLKHCPSCFPIAFVLLSASQHVEWSLGSMPAATQDWGGGYSIMYQGELGGTPVAL